MLTHWGSAPPEEDRLHPRAPFSTLYGALVARGNANSDLSHL